MLFNVRVCSELGGPGICPHSTYTLTLRRERDKDKDATGITAMKEVKGRREEGMEWVTSGESLTRETAQNPRTALT